MTTFRLDSRIATSGSSPPNNDQAEQSSFVELSKYLANRTAPIMEPSNKRSNSGKDDAKGAKKKVPPASRGVEVKFRHQQCEPFLMGSGIEEGQHSFHVQVDQFLQAKRGEEGLTSLGTYALRRATVLHVQTLQWISGKAIASKFGR